jgi:hypothetical protein
MFWEYTDDSDGALLDAVNRGLHPRPASGGKRAATAESSAGKAERDGKLCRI